MPNSHGESVDARCANCLRVAGHTLWTTIDIAERPDLEQAILADRLRTGTCPYCSAPVPLPSAPLLMYRPGRQPPLVLAYRPEDEDELVDLMTQLLLPLRHVHKIWEQGIATVTWADLGAAVWREQRSMREAPGSPGDLAEHLEAFYDGPSTKLKMLACWGGGEKYLEAAFAGTLDAKALAERYLSRALEHAENLGHGPGAEPDPLMLHQSLARLHIELAEGVEDYDRALIHLRAEAAGAVAGSKQQARALGNWGELLMHRPGGDRATDLDEAVDVLTASAQAWVALGNREEGARQDLQVAKALSLRAEVGQTPSHIQWVRPEQADILQRTRRAVDTLAEIGSDHLWTALLALGNAQAQTVDLRSREEVRAEAIATYQRGLKVAGNHPERAAYFHCSLANLYQHEHDLDSAIEHYEQALRLARGAPMGIPPEQIQTKLAAALQARAADNDRDRAVGLLSDALEHNRRAGNDRESRATLRQLADEHFDRENWRAAADYYEQAWAIDEQLFGGVWTDAGRRVELIQGGRLHSRWAYALLRDRQTEEAMVVLERGRTRTLRRATPLQSVAADVRAAVPIGGALVMLLSTSAGGAAIVLTADSTKVVLLGGFTDEKAQHLLQARARLLGVSETEYVAHYYTPSFQTSNVLHIPLSPDERPVDMPAFQDHMWRLVAAPIDAVLPPGCPVRLLPGGGLGLLPWPVAGPLGGALWLENHPISIAPSAFALRTARTTASATPESDLLVVADPTGDLLATLAEATLIMADLDHRRSNLDRHPGSGPAPGGLVLAGLQATPAGLQAALAQSRPRVLHLAGHAYYDWDDPAKSHLLLHGAGVGMDEMLDMVTGSGVDTVILSACETATTTAGPLADELLGWPALFLQAGVTTVVSTLWRVHDVVAAVLMPELYRRLAAGSPPAEALRDAQLWLREAAPGAVLQTLVGDDEAVAALRAEIEAEWVSGFSDPVHWAAFIVTTC